MLGSDSLPIQTRQNPSWINELGGEEKVGHTKTRDPKKQAQLANSPKPEKCSKRDCEGIYNLVSTLARLDMTDFTHFVGEWRVLRTGQAEKG